MRAMSRIYLSYDPEQKLLLPPDLRDWLPEGHLALFISDMVDELDLSAIVGSYESGDGRGRPPYHPLMMVKLLDGDVSQSRQHTARPVRAGPTTRTSSPNWPPVRASPT